MEVRLIPVDQIVEDPDQPRHGYDEESLRGLAESIRQHGLLNPITVRPLHHLNMFQIVTGERRWAAAKLAGLTHIPCIVKAIDAEEAFIEQLTENLQREELAPIDKARGLKTLKERTGASNRELARMLGLSERTIRTLLGLLELPEEIGEQVVSSPGRPAAGTLTERHARSLRELNEYPELQRRVAEKIRQEELTGEETAELVRQMREAPERAEELLERAAVETIRKEPAITGPALQVQHFTRYLESLELSALHLGQRQALQRTLEELLEVIAQRLQSIREMEETPGRRAL